MDSNMTAGTRDLVLSGSFAMPVAAVRLRIDQGKPAAEIGVTVLCHGTSLIGIDVPTTDRMRLSAAEP